VSLDIALPVSFYKIVTGYKKQLAAEMLFIRTSVFLTPSIPALHQQAMRNLWPITLR
jgi:hypothetical protein